jgi:hypothetical protein
MGEGLLWGTGGTPPSAGFPTPHGGVAFQSSQKLFSDSRRKMLNQSFISQILLEIVTGIGPVAVRFTCVRIDLAAETMRLAECQ